MTEEQNQKLADKIRALVAKAESTDNEHEADAFMAKALELLDRHRLTLASLKDESDPMGRTLVHLKWDNSWRKSVSNNAALYFGCRAVFTTVPVINKNGRIQNETAVEIIGRLGARTTTEAMIPYLIGAAARAGRKLAGPGAGLQDKRKREARVGEALASRLYRLHTDGLAREQAAKDSGRPPVAGGSWLVPLDEAQAAVNEFFGKLGKARISYAGYTASDRAAAEGISLSSQMGAGSSSSTLALGSR